MKLTTSDFPLDLLSGDIIALNNDKRLLVMLYTCEDCGVRYGIPNWYKTTRDFSTTLCHDCLARQQEAAGIP